MSSSYERIDRRQGRQRHGGGRGVFGFWVPLALTVTVATMGIAAWIWSERGDNEEDDQDYDYDQRGEDGQSSGARPPPQYGDLGRGETSFVTPRPPAEGEAGGAGVMSRVSDALGRTPSPQQIFDSASRTVAAGAAAAGAVVGGALASIREEDKDDYGDHSRWSEEQRAHDASEATGLGQRSTQVASSSQSRAGGFGPSQGAVRRKTIAIVLSAEMASRAGAEDGGDHHEDASILSHLPPHINHATSRLFVLIYAPDLKQHPLSTNSPRLGESTTSSYSNIGHDEARSPGEGGDQEKPLRSIDPNPLGSPGSASPAYNSLHAQALSLVEDETMIMPFTTPTGHVHILRHLAPEVVYVQESLSGVSGDAVAHISGWVGQVIVVVGAEGGHGGLIDSDDEATLSSRLPASADKWWQSSDRVGLGKGVDVVDGMRVGDDWAKRIGGRE